MEVGDSDITRPTNRERAAKQAEKDAEARIAAANRRAMQAEKEAEARVEQMKDEFIRSEAHLTQNSTEALQAQRQKNYENLKELKRAADTETLRFSRDGGQNLKTMDQEFHQKEYDLKREGDEKLQVLSKTQMTQQEFLRQQNEKLVAEMRAANAMATQQLKSQEDMTLEASREKSLAETESLTENHRLQTLSTQERFENQFKNQIDSHQESLSRLDGDAAAQLQQKQADYARKLTAYSDRARDPFYQMIDLQAQVEETAEAYVIRTKVPVHERDHMSVSVQGNQLVISGQRKNSENLELTPGHKTTTSSFQSYSQTVPLSHPVDAKALYREFDGENFVVIVPKATVYSKPLGAQKPTPDAVRAERPAFPGNLPLAQAADEPPPSSRPGRPVRGKPGNTIS